MESREHGAQDSVGSERENRQHDPIYRRIFNRAQIMEEILSHFVPGLQAEQFDFSTLAPVPSDFIAKYLKKYEGDLIWRVRYGPEGGSWFYVFVLMELQSSVQYFMALRLWGYMCQLCEVLLAHGKYLPQRRPHRLLPPVLPVVLYNGEEPWRAPRSLAQLFQKMEGFTPPDFEFLVLDVNRYSPEQLRPVTNVTSGVFLMEQSQDVMDLQEVLDELEEVVEDPDLAYDLASLVSDLAVKLDLSKEEIPQFKTLEEVRVSLLQRADKWTQQWKEEGLAEGRAEGLTQGLTQGRAEGRVEGLTQGRAEGGRLVAAKILKSQLRSRFGELSPQAMDRIDRADVDTLERWAQRILDATSTDEVLGD